MIGMKKQLRKNVLSHLANLNEQNKLFIEEKFYHTLFQTDIWKESSVIGTTYSTENEWNTKPIIERAWQDGKQIAIPKSNHQSKEMKFYELNHFDELIVGDYNIKEPKKNNQMIDKEIIDLLIVPGVVYNSSGYRIGFGGGFYDRFLSDFSGETVSLVASFQINELLPVEEHDLPVKYYITEEKIMKITP